MKRLAAILITVMILATLSTACADLKKGSKGEEVTELQQMLVDLGFLDDKVDGAFGSKTEAAVKAFQSYAGLKANGRADDTTIMNLYDVYGTAFAIMEGDGLGPEELMEIYPHYCSFEGADEWGATFCYRHLEMEFVSRWLYRAGMPARLERLLTVRGTELWIDAIQEMFDEWEGRLSIDQQSSVANQRAAFESTIEELVGDRLDEGNEESLLRAFTYLEDYSINLCSELHRQ